MRICRYLHAGEAHTAFYYDDAVVALRAACEAAALHGLDLAPLNGSEAPLDLLPCGRAAQQASTLAAWLDKNAALRQEVSTPLAEVVLQRPIAAPPKILLLAGNYAAHIEEEGQTAVERQETFPYVFMKPHTTLNDPEAPIPIPACSPDHIDYECELGVVIGRTAKAIPESEALAAVAGYTVMNDISDRRFQPNPQRRPREKDVFFDWLHGKWHNGFCPVGPAVTSAAAIDDPQALSVELKVNGEVRQAGTTSQMIFPVAAIVAFVSQWVTLEPGDLIATGTPAGVGAASGRFLQPGDKLEARIAGVGTLRNTMA